MQFRNQEATGFILLLPAAMKLGDALKTGIEVLELEDEQLEAIVGPVVNEQEAETVFRSNLDVFIDNQDEEEDEDPENPEED